MKVLRYKNLPISFRIIVKTRLFFKLTILFVIFLFPFAANAVTLRVGDLVKLEGSKSVYQIQPDGTRLLFPNEEVYRDYYDNFNDVKTVSFNELKEYKLAGNIVLKVGSLVKFDTSSKVYEVKTGGELEWIRTERGFKRLGYDFSRVIALPEILLSNYCVRVENGDYDEVLKQIRNRFIYRDRTENIEDIASSAKGAVEALGDEYSVFWTAEEYAEFVKMMSNETFEGIGARIEIRDSQLTVVAPLKGSPAEAAGLQAGDIIKLIDNYDTTAIDINKAVMLIRGEMGTTVTLTIQREGFAEPISISIVRSTIIVKSFAWETKQTPKGKNVVYLDLTRFDLSAWQDFTAAKDRILATEPDGMILDLRNNPGGYLQMAIDVAGKWLGEGELVLSEERVNNQKIRYIAGAGNDYVGIPLIVLVNRGSASASEIVAGALQNHKVAILIGENTFGKGTVQELITLSDGNVIKLTISEWLTPNGNKINKIGITPDVVVKNDDNGGDLQLEKALEELDLNFFSS